jgi:hypothetical protein
MALFLYFFFGLAAGFLAEVFFSALAAGFFAAGFASAPPWTVSCRRSKSR